MDLFKMSEGWNTDIFKRGEVFYAHYTYPGSKYGDLSKVYEHEEKEFKGNIIIGGCSPTTLTIRTIADLEMSMELQIDYYRVKSGEVKIHEMRLLK